MSHLSLCLKTSRNRLVELVRQYNAEIVKTTDTFAHAELVSYLDTIFQFCVRRGGLQYWESVNKEASDFDDPFGYAPGDDMIRDATMIFSRH